MLRICSRAAFALIVFAVLVPSASNAQSIDDVHITPQVKPRKDLPIGTETKQSTLAVRVKPLRVDVDLVLVPVTVTDIKNRPVMDLQKRDFQLFEGQKEEPIQYFFAEDAPISVGVLVDLSSSMANKIDAVKEAAREFFNNANPLDDYFVITFANHPKLLANTTQSVETILEKLAQMEPKGNTALADAVYMGLTKLRSSFYRRKALVIISDGGDNNSRYTLREVKKMAEESDAQIYAIDVCDSMAVLFTKKIEERFGRRWLTQITEVTGGRTIAVDDASKIPSAASTISTELRNQYVLGYRPSNSALDGKWRKIKVRVEREDNSLPLQVYYKTGYMAPRE